MKSSEIKKCSLIVFIFIFLFSFVFNAFDFESFQIFLFVLLTLSFFLLYLMHKRAIRYNLMVNGIEKEDKDIEIFEKIKIDNENEFDELNKKNEKLLSTVSQLDEMFYEIINNYSSVIYVMNDKQEFEVVNNEFLNFFDLEKEVVIGKTCKILMRTVFTSEDYEIEYSQNLDLINGKTDNIRFIKKFNNYFSEDVYLNYNKIVFNYNDRKYILGISTNITDQITKEKDYNNIIIDLRNKFIKKNNLLSYFEEFEMLLSKAAVANEEEFENLIIDIFDFSIKLMEEADCGSVYIFENDVVKYLKAYGYNIDELNNAKIPKERFLKNLVNDPHIEVNYGPSDLFIEDENFYSKKISESIRIPLIYSKNIIGSISIDINRNKKFSESSILLMNTISKFNNIVISLILGKFTKKSFEKNMIKALLNMLEIHDEYTNDHSDNVAILARKLAIRLDLVKEDVERVYWAGITHDIGKIEISSEILNKKGKLTVEEFDKIKMHPVIGYEALSSLESLKDISEYVLHHHERIDGNGYPDGLKGDEIPYISKILTVADSWDAMTSERPYRKPLSLKNAVKQLRENTGTQFDSLIVNEFIKLLYSDKVIDEEISNN
jgi:HD-GYP domain-containing protein (c-di-GMP phosphodiesterase class II)